MRMRLFGLLGGLLLLALPLSLNAGSTPIGGVLGGSITCPLTSAACANPLPLSLSTVCSTGCPLMTRPSFTDANRMWGSAVGGATTCHTSTDGGATWGLCASQPLSSGTKENYAGTADGSVIAAARVGADCKISKSTNNGTSWVSVYTGVGENCGGTAGAPTQVACFPDGSCVFIFAIGGGVGRVLRSTDNGGTWALVHTASPSFFGVQAFSYTGTHALVPAIGAGTAGVSGTGATWANGGAWAAGASCFGGFFLGTTPFGVCYSGAGTIYQIKDGGTGTVLFSPSLPGAVPSANVGGPSLGFGSTAVYTLAAWQPASGNAPIGVYISQDSGATYQLIGLSSILANAMQRGDFWRHPINGCLYWSAGNTVPQFMKICP